MKRILSLHSREGNVLHASLYPNKVVSTIYHLASQTIRPEACELPFRLQTENIIMISFNKRMFHIPLAKQEALHSLEPKAC